MPSISLPVRRRRSRNLGAVAAVAAAVALGAAPAASPVVSRARADNRTAAALAAPGSPAAPAAPAGPAAGYWLVASDGGIFAFGDARFHGSTGALHLNQPITGMAPTPSGNGYWLVASDGGIFAFGDAGFFGSTGAIRLNRPITGMAATPSGRGYWLVASDGGIFAFGDAGFFGSTGAIRLNRPITGMAATPSGRGYWLVASDGGIFAFGDARFYGSTGAVALNQPITGMAATASGRGYWLTASDGGVFSFGDAAFHGAAPSRPSRVPRTVAAMVPSPSGGGYWQVAASGELLAFGDAANLGGVSNLNRPIVGMAAVPRPPAPGSPAPGAPAPPSGAPAGPPAPGGPATPPTTAPPPGSDVFSSTALSTWGTAFDARTYGNSGGGSFPYAQNVSAVTEVGDRFFVAGEFTNLVDTSGAASPTALPYLVEFDVNTGAPVAGSAFNANVKPDGIVNALVPSPDGRRLYVGGQFKTIGGGSMPRLAAIDVDTGQLDTTFQPPTPSAHVNTLYLFGSRLYVGGAFADVGGTPFPGLAAVDAGDGHLDTGFTPPKNYGGIFETHTGKPVEDSGGSYTPGVVGSVVVTADGSYVIVAGNFLHFGTDPSADPGHQHGGVIALDQTGALTAWQPYSTRPGFALALSPADGKTVYAAQGGAGGVVSAYVPGAPAQGKKPAGSPVWVGHVDGDATGVAATAQRVYLVGHYDHEVPDAGDPCLKLQPQPGGQMGVSCPAGLPHRHLAAFDLSGNVDPAFTAQADTPEGPNDVYVGAHHLYVGGNFTKVSDTPQANYRPQPGLAVYPAIG